MKYGICFSLYHVMFCVLSTKEGFCKVQSAEQMQSAFCAYMFRVHCALKCPAFLNE